MTRLSHRITHEPKAFEALVRGWCLEALESNWVGHATLEVAPYQRYEAGSLQALLLIGNHLFWAEPTLFISPLSIILSLYLSLSFSSTRVQKNTHSYTYWFGHLKFTFFIVQRIWHTADGRLRFPTPKIMHHHSLTSRCCHSIIARAWMLPVICLFVFFIEINKSFSALVRSFLNWILSVGVW